MLTDSQIQAGQERLEGGNLSTGDRTDLLAIFRLWLGPRASLYPNLASALSTAVSPAVERLAGALILLKGMNFSTLNLEGGRLGLKSSKQEKRGLIIRYAFSQLYDLPEDEVEEPGMAGLTGSLSVPLKPGW